MLLSGCPDRCPYSYYIHFLKKNLNKIKDNKYFQNKKTFTRFFFKKGKLILLNI
jgi:hypothetical protein